MLTKELLQLDLDMSKEQVEILTLDGEILCETDRKAVVHLKARIKRVEAKLSLFIN